VYKTFSKKDKCKNKNDAAKIFCKRTCKETDRQREINTKAKMIQQGGKKDTV
jgi:hypothetical protein